MFPYKVDVSNGQSGEIQEHALTLGYAWEYDQLAIDDRFKPCHLRSHFLYFNKNGTIFYGDDLKYFREEREHRLLSAEEFLNLIKK